MTKKNTGNSVSQKVVDPVLPDQGGRMMQSDPGHIIPTSEQDVRCKAYELYEARGKTDGSALDDWLAAESTRRGK
jgi:hypothetical protein